jgi:nicotinamidase-related amidase
VIVFFRPSYPEISPRNLTFSALKGSGHFVDDEVQELSRPAGRDLRDQAARFGFSGSNLEFILRAHDINHLILTDIATSGVVLSTPQQVADADYRLTVLSDAQCQQGALPVETSLCLGIAAFGYVPKHDPKCRQSQNRIDQEDRPPGPMIDKPAAEQRP